MCRRKIPGPAASPRCRSFPICGNWARRCGWDRREPPAQKNVVMQQMEHDDMASEDQKERPFERPEHVKDSRSGKERPSENPSPLMSDGPELVRDTHC